MRKFYEKQAAKLGLVGAASVAYIESALAAVDTTAVGTAITGAQTSAETVGGFVIAAVAGLVVIGLIIGVVKKL